MNIELLNQKFVFTATELAILEFLNENKQTLSQLTIRDVAQQVYTSPSTIIKLAKKMNLSGYSELVFKIRENSLNVSHTTHLDYSPLEEISVISSEQQAQFNQIMQRFQRKNIMLIASGFSQIIAEYINETLLLHDIPSIKNTHLELLQPKKAQDNLLIVISESGETTRVKELAIDAKKNHFTIISFTGNPLSTVHQQATLKFSIHSFSGFQRKKHQPKYFYGNVLLLFERLLSNFLDTTRP